ncbi:MAG: putative sulfate exporter family transporter [Planctomycetes bacterium]|nr:putative sulfate exporter family transporter [Planctomycetota bacterium]
MQAAVFFLLSVASVVWLSPPLALAAGIFMAVTIGSYQAARVQKASKFLLQASVVGLGFGMHFGQGWAATPAGFFFAGVTLFCTLALGALIGRLPTGESPARTPLPSRPAICGGSAIAAVGAAIHADKEAMTVALATVFTLNAVALFLFPPIGELLELSQHQFGLWSAIAIHDTSSVVGAAAKYGDEALQIATTVKLTRALWILPLVAVIGMRQSQHGGKVSIPWFVFLFVGAAGLRQALPDAHATFDHLKQLARIGLTLTLFFIGSTMSKQAMRKIGVKPMLQGTLLWLLVSSLTLIAVRL